MIDYISLESLPRGEPSFPVLISKSVDRKKSHRIQKTAVLFQEINCFENFPPEI